MARKANTVVKETRERGDNPVAEKEVDGANSLAKTLSILDLFTSSKPSRSIDEILESLRTSRSTGYRYIRALASAGLLSAVGNGHYILGPRIIELDLQIRSTDPLIKASEGILEELVAATGHSAILCMLFQNSVLCIKERRAQLSPKDLFSRGQRRPLFKGAMSRVILAHLPNHRLRSIFSRRGDAISEANLGHDWSEFRDGLAKIRANGFVKSIGEFNPGIVGIAAPVFNVEGAIIGSVGVAGDKRELADLDNTRVILSVKRAAREISERLANIDSSLAQPPRAVGNAQDEPVLPSTHGEEARAPKRRKTAAAPRSAQRKIRGRAT